jgi:Leucine-rich repeat (LRR) protein
MNRQDSAWSALLGVSDDDLLSNNDAKSSKNKDQQQSVTNASTAPKSQAQNGNDNDDLDKLLNDIEQVPTVKLSFIKNTFQQQKVKSQGTLSKASSAASVTATQNYAASPSIADKKVKADGLKGSSSSALKASKIAVDNDDDDFKDIEAMADEAESKRVPLSLGGNSAFQKSSQSGTLKQMKPVIQTAKKVDIDDDDDLKDMEDLAAGSSFKPLKLPSSGSLSPQKPSSAKDFDDTPTATVKFIGNRASRPVSTDSDKKANTTSTDHRGTTEKNTKDKNVPGNKQNSVGAQSKGPAPPPKKIMVKGMETKEQLSRDQLNDLEDFLNDDDLSEAASAQAQFVFGSFLAPNAAQQSAQGNNPKPLHNKNLDIAKGNPRRESRLQPSFSENADVNIKDMKRKILDFSYGQNKTILTLAKEVRLDETESLFFEGNNAADIKDGLDVLLSRWTAAGKSETHWNLSSCNLDSLGFLTRLSGAKSLDIKNNNLKTGVIGYPLTIQSLHHNDIDNVQLSANPKLQSLEVLDLSCNLLTSFPKEVLKLTNLTLLDLSGNKLETVDDKLYTLKSLKKLYINDNLLKTVPRYLDNLPSLEELHLRNNLISFISNHMFEKLKNLRELDLRGNLLKEVPSSIGNLPNLEYLDIRHNKIDVLPSFVFTLKIDVLLVSKENVRRASLVANV